MYYLLSVTETLPTVIARDVEVTAELFDCNGTELLGIIAAVWPLLLRLLTISVIKFPLAIILVKKKK